MKERLERLKQQPLVARLLVIADHFAERSGSQFSAAIAYYSVLALVPILMFAFSMLGMTLTVLRPDLLDVLRGSISNAMNASPDLGQKITQVVDDALANWRTILTIGAVSILWVGQSWIANLKSAVRAQLRPAHRLKERKAALPLEMLGNVAILIGLLVCLGLTLGLSIVATAARSTVSEWLHLDGVAGGWILLQGLPLLASLVAAFVLFWFMFRVFVEDLLPRRPLLIGAAAGAVGMVVLEYLTSLLFGLFGKNATAAIFGPIIVLMLFFNLFAQLILFVAAGIATDPTKLEWDAVAAAAAAAKEAAEVVPEELAEAPVLAPVASLADRPAFTVPGGMVDERVAQQGVRAGLGAGWVTGVATGVGVGAAVVSMLKRPKS
ncbi:MAG: YihY/virulence factor BrkB family protein [Micropruina sp.]|nr:YihY/virulence factor BrkB family protein [Micropruina sp.]